MPKDSAAPVELPARAAAAKSEPDRNLGLELVRVTEAAAIAAGQWVGRATRTPLTLPHLRPKLALGWRELRPPHPHVEPAHILRIRR